MADNTTRTVQSGTDSNGKLDVSALVLTAVLAAAGFILNITVGQALATTGIHPQFVIAAYCLAIYAIRPKLGHCVVIGLICAVVAQLNTSIPGMNFITEACGSLVMGLFVNSAFSKSKAMPYVAAFVATFVSGMLFAVLGNVVMGADMATILVKLPVVFGTAAFNTIVVGLLAAPVAKAANRK